MTKKSKVFPKGIAKDGDIAWVLAWTTGIVGGPGFFLPGFISSRRNEAWEKLFRMDIHYSPTQFEETKKKYMRDGMRCVKVKLVPI